MAIESWFDSGCNGVGITLEPRFLSLVSAVSCSKRDKSRDNESASCWIVSCSCSVSSGTDLRGTRSVPDIRRGLLLESIILSERPVERHSQNENNEIG